MTISEQIIAQTEQYGAQHYKPLPVVIAEAEGVWVTDVEGQRYIDMLSGYSAVSHGHRHPRLLEAAKRQMDRVTLTARAFHNDQVGPLLQQLSEFCGMDKALLMNTGAEAVETAVKLARKWGYRVKGVPHDQAEIIVCDGNFHGRTTTVISFSSEELYKHDFGPLTPGFRFVPFGDVAALEAAITPNTVGFLVEPIQGEGGINVPPDGYLAAVRDICNRHKVLLLLDEIQVGLGRTGKRFCYQHDGIEPDILILGKALGGGIFPVSAIATKADLLGLFVPGEHGSTFGANPLACAIASEALHVIEDEQLAERSAEMGAYLLHRLQSIESPFVKEVRGKGLLIGVELKPELGGARPFCLRLLANGVLCKESHEHVIRFAPPLVVNREELDWALERIEAVLMAEDMPEKM
ncbi:MAG: ornithine--oxo-acid transaminase [Anaerolineaceae bacterium]|nr:ornithine--oxo-acid transaminase [Anaerolineaceae bacterium]